MPVSVHRRRPSAASAPPTSPPRRNRLRRAALAAGVTALGVATLSSTASAASKPFYNAEGLGKITLFWTTSLADAPRFQVIENGAIVDTTGPTTAGAGYFGTLTIPDANLYAAGGTTFTINKVDGSGTVLESSDPLTIPACPDVPPRAASPTNAKLAANGSTTVGISWSTPNPDVCHTTPTGYTVTVGDQTRTVSGSFTSAAQVSGLTPNTPYTASITSLPSSTVQPESPATVSFTTTPGSDTTPPTKPVILSAGHTDPAGNTTVTWSPSTDDTGVVAYDVHAGTLASAPIATVAGIATSVSAHVGVITSGGTQVWVVARDADGNATASDPVGVNTCGMLPSGTLSVDSSTATGVTSTGATVSWTAAGQPGCRPALDHWLVQRSSGAGAPVAVGTIPAGQTTIAASGLTPATTYTFTITGVLADGSTTDPSAASTLTVVTLPDTSGPTTYGFIAAGSATLKNLVKGSVPLSGVFNTTAASDGSFTGQLGLAPATASLKALGFLPVTATVSFVSVGDVTGTSTATSLSAVANERIKLPSIKSFGIQLAGGASCQATQVSKIALSSTGAFTWATGGSVAGTFSISNLSGCGALNGIVSSLTAGGGNAIALTLRPTATPPAPTV